MKILVVSATSSEIEKVQSQKWSDVLFLHTGVGMVATAFTLTEYLHQHRIDLVINAGIAGGFDQNLPLGSVFNVVEDAFSELGAEDNGQWITIDALGLGTQKVPCIGNASLEKLLRNLPKAQGITVNTVHGNRESICQVRKLFPKAQVETMESAAVMYVCAQMKVPCVAIRSTSNYVEPRNRENWQISLAIQRLNDVILDILSQFQIR